MLLAYSIFRNLAVMFRVTLLSGGATALFTMVAGFDLLNFFKGDGRKKIEASAH